jgi:hypothetical protein
VHAQVHVRSKLTIRWARRTLGIVIVMKVHVTDIDSTRMSAAARATRSPVAAA